MQWGWKARKTRDLVNFNIVHIGREPTDRRRQPEVHNIKTLYNVSCDK